MSKLTKRYPRYARVFCSNSMTTKANSRTINKDVHIRDLTSNGPRYAGYCDTDALCGMVVSWDLDGDIVITTERLEVCCQKCKEVYENKVSELSSTS